MWRPGKDELAHDAQGRRREAAIQAMFLLYVHLHILPKEKAKKKAGQEAKPQSVRNVLGGVRRAHKRQQIKMVDCVLVGQLVDGMCRRFVKLFGPEALQPHRKEPLPYSVFFDMLAMHKCAGIMVGGRIMAHDHIFWVSFFAAMCVSRQTGYRKAEVGVPTGDVFGRCHLSRASVAWRIGGEVIADPSPAQLRALKEGDVALIHSPPMKNDQYGDKYGVYPSYLSYYPEDDSAAYRLAQIELCFPVRGAHRRETPLFCAEVGAAMTHSQLDNTLRALLLRVLQDENEAAKYSWHSFRIALACGALKVMGNNPETRATIQAICRWATVESLKVYARLEATTADIVKEASRVDFSSVLVANAQLPDDFPPIDNDLKWAGLSAHKPHHFNDLQKDGEDVQ